MDKLNLKVEKSIDSVEKYEFEPIKGFARLRWQGRRVFTSTQYYPAQLKETYGEEVDEWFNKLFWGDNLQVMSHLLKDYRGRVDLIYIDPPFDSKADYKKTIELKGKKVKNSSTSFEEKQYTDIWNNDEYLQFMYERLILMRELLSDRGTIYLHCDWHKSHLLRMLLDEVFGDEHCLNELVWYYRRWTSVSNTFQKMHDTILMYSKTKDYTFNPIYIDSTEGQKKKHERGYDRNSVMIDGSRRPQLLVYNEEKTKEAVEKGIINLDDFARIVHVSSSKTIAHDVWESDIANSFEQVFIEHDGSVVSDVWKINYINSQSTERTDYPTQKPESLLERIILASSNPGDIVFDCFMGSGTTQVVAMKLGRKFLGADINVGSIDTTVSRLIHVRDSIIDKHNTLPSNADEQTLCCYTGFEVYNVNNYDVFRNPVEAKQLLIQALELQPLPNNGLYDGEKDGRMVRIMPINRISTRADLNELINNFPYSLFDKRKEASPNTPVESITLVCMGHEPDLGSYLVLQMKTTGYLVDVEVLDILTDRKDIEFKRDSEADIHVEGNKLVIRDFYPMNLLQKLSLQKEEVDDWRTMVSSIKIDYYYDGSVFSPSLIDVPEGQEVVKGFYTFPKDASKIRVKITDVLSESFEKTIEL